MDRARPDRLSRIHRSGCRRDRAALFAARVCEPRRRYLRASRGVNDPGASEVGWPPGVTDGVVHTTACVSQRSARGVHRVSASAPAAGGDLLDDQKRNLMPDLPVDQSAHLMCDLLLVPPVDLRDGHHAFQDAAVLGAVNARRQHSPAPTARSARPSVIDRACARRCHWLLRDGRHNAAFDVSRWTDCRCVYHVARCRRPRAAHRLQFWSWPGACCWPMDSCESASRYVVGRGRPKPHRSRLLAGELLRLDAEAFATRRNG